MRRQRRAVPRARRGQQHGVDAIGHAQGWGMEIYLVTFLQHEVREAQSKEKKTKRRKKGDFLFAQFMRG